MGNHGYPFRPSRAMMRDAQLGGKTGAANLVVGSPYRIKESGNYPDLVGTVGILIRNKTYRHAVDLLCLDGIEHEFIAEQLEKA